MKTGRHRIISALFVLLSAGCAMPSGDAAPPAKKTTGTKMPAKDIDAITAYHNKVRKNVGVGPLIWSPKLAAFAQEWSDHLASTSCQMTHRQPNKYGENLFMGTASHYHAVDAAKTWEEEKKLYFGGVLKESTWHPAGHYTQMVWRGTTSFGCGQSVCRKTLIVACNYDPPGNYMGRKPY
jgi:pathogenesis-related protein 1